MPDIKRSAVVPYTPAQMYELVNDVEKYPEFIPWIYSTTVHSRDEDECRATMCFEGAGFRKEFTTVNRLQKNKMIELRLENGPFRHLEGFWRFEPEGDGCKVHYDMEFQFSSMMLDLAVGPMFSQASNMLVDLFVKRADEVYQS